MRELSLSLLVRLSRFLFLLVAVGAFLDGFLSCWLALGLNCLSFFYKAIGAICLNLSSSECLISASWPLFRRICNSDIPLSIGPLI